MTTTQSNNSELFQVDLRGVMDILARHLYSTPDVFIRELLQNSADAIAARKESEPEHIGKITFETDDKAGVLTIKDNGVGLTETEIREALSRVGGSTKRQTEERRSTMIGQFGIGMLSCFMVADEIHLLSRSMMPGSSAISWIGRADGTYSVSQSNADVEFGTQITIKLRDDSKKYAENEIIWQLATRYGKMLPIDVGVASGDYRERVSLTALPWDRLLDDPDEARDCKYDLAIWDDGTCELFKLDGGDDFRGVGVIQLGLSEETAKHRHAVYVKNMFVTDSPDELVPEWATFVRCFISSDTLRPTASRESLYDDKTYRRAQDRVADELMRYMHSLAEKNPPLLRALIAEHDLSFRRIALYDDRFFDSILPLLPFETSEGEMTLGEFMKENSVLRVASSSEQFRLAAPIARIGGDTVLNGGYTFHYELLARAAERRQDLEWIPITIDDMIQSLKLAPAPLRDRLQTLADHPSLEDLPAELRLVEFQPEEVTSLYVEGEDGALARSLDSAEDKSTGAWQDAIASIRASLKDSDIRATLCLNSLSPPIKTALNMQPGPKSSAIIRIAYIQALIEAQQPLTSEESQLFTRSLSVLIGEDFHS